MKPNCLHCGAIIRRAGNKMYCNKTCRGAAERYTPEKIATAFWSRVDKSAGEDACWPWTGSVRWDGYGRLRVHGKQVAAQRLSYELAHGPLATGLHVLHRCDNPPCVNPKHLFTGSHRDNMIDRVSKGRHRGNRRIDVHG